MLSTPFFSIVAKALPHISSIASVGVSKMIKSPFVWLRDLPYKRAFYLRFVTCKQRLPIQSVD